MQVTPLKGRQVLKTWWSSEKKYKAGIGQENKCTNEKAGETSMHIQRLVLGASKWPLLEN